MTTRIPAAWGIEFEGSTAIETTDTAAAAEALSRHFASTGEAVDTVSRTETGPWRYEGGHVAAGNEKPVRAHAHAWQPSVCAEGEACACGTVQPVVADAGAKPLTDAELAAKYPGLCDGANEGEL